jgi:hypothetical protein
MTPKLVPMALAWAKYSQRFSVIRSSYLYAAPCDRAPASTCAGWTAGRSNDGEGPHLEVLSGDMEAGWAVRDWLRRQADLSIHRSRSGSDDRFSEPRGPAG